MSFISGIGSGKLIVHAWFLLKEKNGSTSSSPIYLNLFGASVGWWISSFFRTGWCNFKIEKESKRILPLQKKFFTAFVLVLVPSVSLLVEKKIWDRKIKNRFLDAICKSCLTTLNFVSTSGYFEHSFSRDALEELREKVTGCPYPLHSPLVMKTKTLTNFLIFTTLCAIFSRNRVNPALLNLAHTISEVFEIGLACLLRKKMLHF